MDKELESDLKYVASSVVKVGLVAAAIAVTVGDFVLPIPNIHNIDHHILLEANKEIDKWRDE